MKIEANLIAKRILTNKSSKHLIVFVKQISDGMLGRVLLSTHL